MTRQITPAEPPKLDSFIQRFWAKVDKSAGLDACWLWTASTSGAGYGNIGMDGAMKSAHRISWELANGPIPPGMLVRHKCDNPPCVNPRHLLLGTHSDNMQDMLERGRQAKGSKVTEEMVREIRSRYSAGGISQKSLAAEYGIGQRHICGIILRQRWKHVK
jgi:hypothetical protein